MENPVLFYVHGGPGASVTPLRYKYFSGLEHHFLVVCWDQCGAGKSYSRDRSIDYSSVVFEDFLSDLECVIEVVLDRLNKEKLIIIGHSWGSVLGINLIKRRPDLVSSYVGTGQFSNVKNQEMDGYLFSLYRAYSDKNYEALQSLEEIYPYPDVGGTVMEKIFTQRLYVEKYGGSLARVTDHQLNEVAVLSPDITGEEYEEWVQASKGFHFSHILESLFSSESLIGDLGRLGFDFDVPIFFFLGENDKVTSTKFAISYFNNIKAPYKKILIFRDSAHFPPVEVPDQFLDAMCKYVLPRVV